MPRLSTEPVPDFVPTRAQVFQMFLSLLPRGHAWQTHDSAITSTTVDANGVIVAVRPGSILRSLWYALAGPWYTMEVAIGNSLQEYACGTSNVNRDAWIEEYDTGDYCDPYDGDVCAKANDPGGHSAAYYEDIAAMAGWVIDAHWTGGGSLLVDIHTSSPSMPNQYRVKSFRVTSSNWRVNALKSTKRLQCMLNRIVPAHAMIYYSVVV